MKYDFIIIISKELNWDDLATKLYSFIFIYKKTKISNQIQ